MPGDSPLVGILETERFTREADKVFTEEQKTELIDYLAERPLSGALVPGTGGVRKLRWQASGRGKRGGARVIYYYYDESIPLHLFSVYTKSDKDDMAESEKKVFSAAIDVILKTYGKT